MISGPPPQTLHHLTAKAVIRDWTEGSLDADKTQHEVVKRERKDYIINVSKEYSIVSQFTSFVAIEEREKVGHFTSTDKEADCSLTTLAQTIVHNRLLYHGFVVQN